MNNILQLDSSWVKHVSHVFIQVRRRRGITGTVPFLEDLEGFLRFYAPGEKWFHHTLVDADQAINSMMWQNAGKSGLDQWNFTMNAASAGKTQDPKGPVLMERDD